MRLIDFNLSTIDLHPALKLYWESNTTMPITDLQIVATGHQLRLLSADGPALTLDQFRTRCQQVDPQTNLFMASDTEPLRLYGYRLIPHKILLG
ncbi:hypothetical protein [Levilactobacillus fujinensis]|uniref:Uncharacterized protein n=1 Tax=Levilactobacillus fujinensis TaxID=2486024 RepID=A0ABW1TI21_9LACO|nr:hypothetical protein [Levilactobacillus fujinensis]